MTGFEILCLSIISVLVIGAFLTLGAGVFGNSHPNDPWNT